MAASHRAIWAGCELRNERIRSVAPITFRSLDDSIRDCVESLLSVAGIEPVRRQGTNQARTFELQTNVMPS